MSEVALPIGGRTYRVACAPGEEAHIRELGGVINDKLAAMGNLSGHEAQNLLFAALLLADEVHEGREAVSGAESRIAAAQRDTDSASQAAETLRARVTELEAELSGLQGAQRGASEDLENARQRLTALGDRLSEAQAVEAGLRDEIAGLRQELEDAAAQPPPPPPPPSAAGPSGDLAELAPALERLAEMLEDCADKLEGSPQSS